MDTTFCILLCMWKMYQNIWLIVCMIQFIDTYYFKQQIMAWLHCMWHDVGFKMVTLSFLYQANVEMWHIILTTKWTFISIWHVANTLVLPINVLHALLDTYPTSISMTTKNNSLPLHLFILMKPNKEMKCYLSHISFMHTKVASNSLMTMGSPLSILHVSIMMTGM